MRIAALVKRIIRQFIHDKRSLALMFIAPLLILELMSLVFNGNAYHPDMALVNPPPGIEDKLNNLGAHVHVMTSEEAEQQLKDDQIDAILSFQGVIPDLKLEGSDPTVNKSVILLMQNLLQSLNPASAALKSHITYLHGSADMGLFDNIGPVLIAYFVFFFVFLLSGIAFLRERTGGTLERLLSTPVKRWEIVLGYLLGFGLFAALQTVLISWFAVDVLHMMMAGSFWLMLLITLLMAVVALTLGTFLSAFAGNEFQMIQFIPLVIVPQVFFSGLFNMDTMADWLRWIGYVMPLTYAADAMRGVMIRGGGWSDIAVDVWVLLALSLFFAVANVLALKKHRKI